MTRSGCRSTGNTELARQRGYSLLEILIAVLVLSIGLLGLAGLQTTSLQSNQSAAQVSQATFLAQDMLDRMRTNSEVARNGSYNLDFGDSSDDYEGSSLANADRREWLKQVHAAIPGTQDSGCGKGNGDCGASVRVDGDGRAQIIIRWVDERRDEDDDQRVTRFTTESRI